MIEEKIIEDVCDCLQIHPGELKYIFSKVKTLGYLGVQESNHLLSIGIPLIQVFINIMRVKPQYVWDCIKDGKIPYSDLCVMLGIFAQDIMTSRQNKTIYSYSQK